MRPTLSGHSFQETQIVMWASSPRRGSREHRVRAGAFPGRSPGCRGTRGSADGAQSEPPAGVYLISWGMCERHIHNKNVPADAREPNWC